MAKYIVESDSKRFRVERGCRAPNNPLTVVPEPESKKE
jgi:hypothetical protein